MNNTFSPTSYACVIGHFQLVNNGHIALFEQARKVSDHLLVVIGSAFKAINIKHPFCEETREQLIRVALQANPVTQTFKSITYIALADSVYHDDEWVLALHQACKKMLLSNSTLTLVSRKSNNPHSANKLLEWPQVVIDCTQKDTPQVLRELYWKNTPIADELLSQQVPKPVFQFLMDYRQAPQYKAFQEEYQFIHDYKQQFSALPYPPTFNTADAIVTCAGNLLLIQRKEYPGKGLWALPGGFIDHNERAFDGAIRELYEETQIELTEQEIRQAVIAEHLFDEPDRSLRGRTFTMAYHFDLKSQPQNALPKVQGTDDAEQAQWIPLKQVLGQTFSKNLFEDHLDIIKYFVNTSRETSSAPQ